jgi:outer membrane immunogenic protein
MKLKLALAAAAALVAPAFMTANAQQANVYINGGYTQFDGDGGGELGALTGRVGVGFGQHFAVEGEASFGIDDDDGLELDNELGIFGVAKLPLSSQFDIFARAGFARIETSPGGEEDGPAYGVGGQFNFTANDGIRGDWTRHDYDAGDVDAFSVAYVRKF